MFRWSFFVTRLAVLWAAMLFVRFGLDPLLRRIFQKSGEAAVGAKVDIGLVSTSVRQQKLVVRDVVVANPNKDLSNLVQFKQAVLQLDSRALLEKRYVVKKGRITGLIVDGDRDSSGRLAETPESESDASSKLAELGQQWWDDFLARFSTDVEKQFETVQVSQELLERWPREYAAVEARVEPWNRRITELRGVYESLRRNPVRDPAYYQQHLRELDELRNEIRFVRSEADRLRKQAVTDKDRLNVARQHDQQKIRDNLHLDAINPQQLSEYLLGPELHGRIATARQWLARGRDVVSLTAVKPKVNQGRGRGELVPFGSAHLRPQWLVELLQVDGQATVGGETRHFMGLLSGLTNEPKLHGQPLVLQLACDGEMPLSIQAEFDRTSDVPRERFVIDCPHVSMPRRVLGSPDSLAFEVAAGSATCRVQLQVEDETISGRVTWRQASATLTPVLTKHEQVYGINVRESLVTAAKAVRELNATIDVAGTWKEPQIKFTSDLGTQLAGGLRQAFQQELAKQTERLAQRIDREAESLRGQFDGLIATKERELLAKLNLGERELDSLKDAVREHLSPFKPNVFTSNQNQNFSVRDLLK